MFEDITKGVWSIDEARVKVNKYGSTIYPLRVEDGKMNQVNVVRSYEPEGNRQNAEFICFCFNLQQKYDISLFEEAIKTLEGIKSMCDGNVTKENSIWFECNHILNKLK